MASTDGNRALPSLLIVAYMGHTAPAANLVGGLFARGDDGMDEVLRALKYRAEHRGTREADMMIGGFFAAHHESWDAHDRALFAALLMETDVDIMAWVIGTQAAPQKYEGPMMDALRKLDFIKVAK